MCITISLAALHSLYVVIYNEREQRKTCFQRSFADGVPCTHTNGKHTYTYYDIAVW